MKLEGPDLYVKHDINTEVTYKQICRCKSGYTRMAITTSFRIGLGTYVIKNEKTSLSVEAAINDSRDYTTRYNLGSEFIFNIVENQSVALRLGYLGNYDEAGLTAGAGFLVTLGGFNFKFDYAYADMNRLGNSQRYTLSILF
ncbi:MAG: hypothetical protein U5K00_16185 [Melioribacteraceae bacterium]|nr:hypothetical protein [Melioribacteraceae bacterium]